MSAEMEVGPDAVQDGEEMPMANGIEEGIEESGDGLGETNGSIGKRVQAARYHLQCRCACRGDMAILQAAR